eukprot:TRINITY_DN2648_c0_g2_i6.p2 TRINITY_DN2648_c0_g2~~TRINITY_DN2648_c0_g2_i6.p2  ORF type:complete len:137 (-),score=5.70 TRINITY_DN2648_c0_g2_i6:389-799(-)
MTYSPTQGKREKPLQLEKLPQLTSAAKNFAPKMEEHSRSETQIKRTSSEKHLQSTGKLTLPNGEDAVISSDAVPEGQGSHDPSHSSSSSSPLLMTKRSTSNRKSKLMSTLGSAFSSFFSGFMKGNKGEQSSKCKKD